MQLTRAADYAVRVMIHLATLPAGTYVSRSALAAATNVPDSFLSKILQAMSRVGLIVSRRGLDGGFSVLPLGREASLLDVIEAIDGPICLNVCLMSGMQCESQSRCSAHLVWAKAQDAMLSVLRSARIAELAVQAVARKNLLQVPSKSAPTVISGASSGLIENLNETRTGDTFRRSTAKSE